MKLYLKCIALIATLLISLSPLSSSYADSPLEKLASEEKAFLLQVVREDLLQLIDLNTKYIQEIEAFYENYARAHSKQPSDPEGFLKYKEHIDRGKELFDPEFILKAVPFVFLGIIPEGLDLDRDDVSSVLNTQRALLTHASKIYLLAKIGSGEQTEKSSLVQLDKDILIKVATLCKSLSSKSPFFKKLDVFCSGCINRSDFFLKLFGNLELYKGLYYDAGALDQQINLLDDWSKEIYELNRRFYQRFEKIVFSSSLSLFMPLSWDKKPDKP